MKTLEAQKTQNKLFGLISLESSNLWTNIVMIIAGLFVGFPTEAGLSGVAAIFALLASGKAIRTYLKESAKVDWKSALQNSNLWNYIGVVVVAVIPNLPAGIMESLQEIARNAIGGNWQGVVIAVFSLATILYNIFKKQPENV